MSTVEFQPVKDAELSWLDARLNVRRHAAEIEAAMEADEEKKEEEAQMEVGCNL